MKRTRNEVTQYLGTGRGRTVYREEVEAYVLEEVPGLMIHRPVGSTATRGDWRISHRASGQALSLDTFPSLKTAEAAVLELAGVADWTRPAGALQWHPELGRRARSVIAEHLYYAERRHLAGFGPYPRRDA